MTENKVFNENGESMNALDEENLSEVTGGSLLTGILPLIAKGTDIITAKVGDKKNAKKK